MFQRVVVAVDFSQASFVAIRRGRAVIEPGGEVHLVHVVSKDGKETSGDKKLTREQLMKVAKTELPHDGLLVRIHVVPGDPASSILEVARRVDADLVLIGSHARGALGRLLVGSVAEAVARRSEVPVLIVRDEAAGEGQVERVLVAVDDSEPSRQAARAAVRLARVLAAKVEAVRVLQPGPVRDLAGKKANFALDDVPEKIAELLGLGITSRLKKILGSKARIRYVAGEPAGAIAALAGVHDIVACGTHGRTGLDRLAFGSVATELLRAVPCPTLIVRPAAKT